MTDGSLHTPCPSPGAPEAPGGGAPALGRTKPGKARGGRHAPCRRGAAAARERVPALPPLLKAGPGERLLPRPCFALSAGLAAAEGGGLFAAKSLFERVLTKIFSDVTMAAAGAKAPQNERTPVCGDVSQPGPAGAGTRGLSCKAFFLCPEKCACLPAAANGASRALCAVGASEALPAPCRKRACALRRERVF